MKEFGKKIILELFQYYLLTTKKNKSKSTIWCEKFRLTFLPPRAMRAHLTLPAPSGFASVHARKANDKQGTFVLLRLHAGHATKATGKQMELMNYFFIYILRKQHPSICARQIWKPSRDYLPMRSSLHCKRKQSCSVVFKNKKEGNITACKRKESLHATLCC